MSAFASRAGRTLLPVLLAAATAVAQASAQPKTPADEARELGRDAWRALEANDYKGALDKVTRAEALYHAPTHLLVMGNAQAGLGQLADALATFEKLAAEPLPDAAPPPFKDAQEKGRKRMKELLARVPSLLVAIENPDAPAATITVDGQKATFASGVAMRVNPGEHLVSVEASGYLPVKRTVPLPEKGGVVRVSIVLEKVPSTGATASASASASAGPSAGASAGPSAAPTATPGTGPGPLRVPAYAMFGVAGAGLLAGALTGGMSLAMTNDLKVRCDDNECPPDATGDLDTATAFAHASTASFLLAGAAAATAVILLVADPGPKRAASTTPRAARVDPWISFGGAGLRGTF